MRKRKPEKLLPKPLRKMWRREHGRIKDYDVLHFIYGAYTGLIMLIDRIYGLSMLGLFVLYQVLDYTVTKDRPNRDVVTFTTGYTLASLMYLLKKIIAFLI